MNLDSKYYGLHSRIQLEELGSKHIGIVKLIRSRIIRKDAEKIIEIAKTIHQIEPEFKISLICTSNICSKSLALLKEHNIDVQIKEHV
nr:hypothetical protein [uncultured Carboxylicivirga sp.]